MGDGAKSKEVENRNLCYASAITPIALETWGYQVFPLEHPALFNDYQTVHNDLNRFAFRHSQYTGPIRLLLAGVMALFRPKVP